MIETINTLREELEEKGFSVIRSFIEKRICDKLNAKVSSQIDILSQKTGNLAMNIHKDIPEFLAVQSYPPLVEIVQEVLRGPILGLQSQYLFGNASDAGFAPHQDGYVSQAEKGKLLSAWLALDNIGPQNGGLSFWASSHLEGLLPVEELDQEPFKGVIPPKKYPKVDLTVERGDIVFIDSEVIHGSHNNQSPTNTRRALLMVYIREGASYRPGQRAKRKAFQLEYREELL